MGLKENIKMKRAEIGLTLEDVAKYIGVTRQTVQKYESGIVTNIPSDKIEKMAILFQTSPGVLMGWEDGSSKYEILELFPERLKALRKKLGLSQHDVAEAIDVSVLTYGRYESGTQKPSSTVLIKLAGYFGVTVDYLRGVERPEKIYDDRGIVLYNQLDAEDRKRVCDIMEVFLKSDKYSKKTEEQAEEETEVIVAARSDVGKNPRSKHKIKGNKEDVKKLFDDFNWDE